MKKPTKFHYIESNAIQIEDNRYDVYCMHGTERKRIFLYRNFDKAVGVCPICGKSYKSNIVKGKL